MANSSRVTTKARPSSSVAVIASSVIMPALGQAFSLDGRARETICTSTGTASGVAGRARGLELRLQALELGALGFGEALQRAQLDVVAAGTDHPLLGLVDAPPDAVLAQGRDLGLALQPVDDLLDLGADLPVEARPARR